MLLELKAAIYFGGDVMQARVCELSIEALEIEKEMLMKKLLSGEASKKYRNLLYEVLGIIEFKKRYYA